MRDFDAQIGSMRWFPRAAYIAAHLKGTYNMLLRSLRTRRKLLDMNETYGDPSQCDDRTALEKFGVLLAVRTRRTWRGAVSLISTIHESCVNVYRLVAL